MLMDSQVNHGSQGDNAMAHNRYLELTDTQKVHVDRYINSIASGGATDITSAVMCCEDDARKAVTGL